MEFSDEQSLMQFIPIILTGVVGVAIMWCYLVPKKKPNTREPTTTPTTQPHPSQRTTQDPARHRNLQEPPRRRVAPSIELLTQQLLAFEEMANQQLKTCQPIIELSEKKKKIHELIGQIDGLHTPTSRHSTLTAAKRRSPTLEPWKNKLLNLNQQMQKHNNLISHYINWRNKYLLTCELQSYASTHILEPDSAKSHNKFNLAVACCDNAKWPSKAKEELKILLSRTIKKAFNYNSRNKNPVSNQDSVRIFALSAAAAPEDNNRKPYKNLLAVAQWFPHDPDIQTILTAVNNKNTQNQAQEAQAKKARKAADAQRRRDDEDAEKRSGSCLY